MFDQLRLSKILSLYKQSFVTKRWKQEKYKWIAIKWFQTHWNIKEQDFAQMIEDALGKTGNLLTSKKNFPRNMIIKFAKANPEKVREMFVNLFDENQDVFERVNAFKEQATILLEKYGDGDASHFQNENAISTYLWLKYPDKYYIYKSRIISKVASSINSNYEIKRGEYRKNFHNFLKLYDEINHALKDDQVIVNLLKSQMSEECYHDPELKTLTIDFCFYISQYYLSKDKIPDRFWYGRDYNPGLSVDDWSKLLADKQVFTDHALEIMKCMKDCGGMASCTQLAKKYGRKMHFYLSGSVALAKRICKLMSISPMTSEEYGVQWWTVLYVGRPALPDEEGSYIWKLRDELSAALDKATLDGGELFKDSASAGSDVAERQYWWLNANPKMWHFSDINVGEEQSYTLYNKNHNRRRIFQNFLDARKGDMIIGYESSPVKQVVALAQITAEQDGERLYFKKVETLASPIDYDVLKGCTELKNMEYFQNSQGSLFRLTKDEYDFILDLIREENPVQTNYLIESYAENDFLSEVYMTKDRYQDLVTVLRHKKNIILQGAPGVGKTFAAKRLAWSMMGEKDDNRIELIQFHQNYTYEDFMLGYKPVENGFELRKGTFYQFCQKAANQPDKEFFFIIDEVNRGNISKIFGELLMLIEKDYRGTRATLAYDNLTFSVPQNLYIIGMMNTADRSLAMIDYALRRRFSFFDMEPAFDIDAFVHYQNSLDSEKLNELIAKVKDLNHELASDRSLGKGFCIGHSYFCGQDVYSEEWLRSIVNYDILPLLREYWFDDNDKAQHWENILQGIFK